ncbi:MAG: hydrogenase [Deltaproteobacteria bacterium]
MFEPLIRRIRTGSATLPLPAGNLPPGFRGAPEIDPDRFRGKEAARCASVCPTEAIDPAAGTIDLGRCLFCGLCEEACGGRGIRYTPDPDLPCGTRSDLVVGGGTPPAAALAAAEIRRRFGRSLHLREVSAGGCNGCDLEAQACGNPVFDLSRFGIDFVASPRHADGLLVTGPVSRAMREPLRRTFEAVPDPRIVIAVGACAASGGIFRGSCAVENGVGEVLPVDLFIPGCPPHPLSILYGILRFLGRKEAPVRSAVRPPGGSEKGS